MRTLLLILLLCTCVRATLSAQATDCTSTTEVEALALKAYLNNSPEAWQTALAAAEALPASTDHHVLAAKILFGATGTAFSLEDEDALDELLDAMEVHLDAALEADKNHPEASALYSGYLGMIISQSPMKGMFYGRKASKLADKATGNAPDSPLTHYFRGSNLYYTPATWGGDYDLAVEHLLRAKENYGAADGCNWFYLQTCALLGQAQLAAGDKAAARQTYLASLQAQPDFEYVKRILLPKLEGTGK
ncbi:MAG: hypothetical protein AAF597_00825 [Bacteroidota bacterium]